MGCKLTKRTSSKVGSIDAWKGAHYQPLIASKINRKLKTSVRRRDPPTSDSEEPPIKFSDFSTTSATYVKSASRASKITLRLSCDGSTLEIEKCDMEYVVNESSASSLSPSSSEMDLCEKVCRSSSVPVLSTKCAFEEIMTSDDNEACDALRKTFVNQSGSDGDSTNSFDSDVNDAKAGFKTKKIRMSRRKMCENGEEKTPEIDNKTIGGIKWITIENEIRSRGSLKTLHNDNISDARGPHSINAAINGGTKLKTFWKENRCDAESREAKEVDMTACFTNRTAPRASSELSYIGKDESLTSSATRSTDIIKGHEMKRKGESVIDRRYGQMSCQAASRFSDLPANSSTCQLTADRLLKPQYCNNSNNDHNLHHRVSATDYQIHNLYSAAERADTCSDIHENYSSGNNGLRNKYGAGSLFYNVEDKANNCSTEKTNVYRKGQRDNLLLDGKDNMLSLCPMSASNIYRENRDSPRLRLRPKQNNYEGYESRTECSNQDDFSQCQTDQSFSNGPTISFTLYKDTADLGHKNNTDLRQADRQVDSNHSASPNIQLTGTEHNNNFDSYINFIRRKGEGAIPKRRLLNFYQNYSFSPLPAYKSIGTKHTTITHSSSICGRNDSVRPLNVSTLGNNTSCHGSKRELNVKDGGIWNRQGDYGGIFRQQSACEPGLHPLVGFKDEHLLNVGNIDCDSSPVCSSCAQGFKDDCRKVGGSRCGLHEHVLNNYGLRPLDIWNGCDKPGEAEYCLKPPAACGKGLKPSDSSSDPSGNFKIGLNQQSETRQSCLNLQSDTCGSGFNKPGNCDSGLKPAGDCGSGLNLPDVRECRVNPSESCRNGLNPSDNCGNGLNLPGNLGSGLNPPDVRECRLNPSRSCRNGLNPSDNCGNGLNLPGNLGRGLNPPDVRECRLNPSDSCRNSVRSRDLCGCDLKAWGTCKVRTRVTHGVGGISKPGECDCGVNVIGGCSCVLNRQSGFGVGADGQTTPKRILANQKQIDYFYAQTCAIKSGNKKEPLDCLACSCAAYNTMTIRNMD